MELVGSRLVQQFWESAQRGAYYLTANQDESGLVGSTYILDYYKAPWALAATGHICEAWCLLDWIKANVQTRPGQYHSGDDFPEVLRSSTYRNTFIMLGALILGRFDIVSEEAITDFKRYQHPIVGAFYGEQNRQDAAVFNTNHSGLAGLFSLYAGLIDQARVAGNYVLKHLADQPCPDRVFYINTDTAGQLITSFPEDSSFWHSIDYSRPQGHYWAIGTGASFLAQLYSRTSEMRYLEGAKRLLRLTSRFATGYESWPSSGKIAWGAAQVYACTREEEFRYLAMQVGHECFVKTQAENGSWGPFFFRMGNDPTKGYQLSTLELTAEFTILTSELAKCLSN